MAPREKRDGIARVVGFQAPSVSSAGLGEEEGGRRQNVRAHGGEYRFENQRSNLNFFKKKIESILRFLVKIELKNLKQHVLQNSLKCKMV
jgi:hypothetical protein